MDKRCGIIMPLGTWPYARRCVEEGVKSLRPADGSELDNVWCCPTHVEEGIASGAVEGETMGQRCLRETDNVPIRAIKLYRTYTNVDLKTALDAIRAAQDMNKGLEV